MMVREYRGLIVSIALACLFAGCGRTNATNENTGPLPVNGDVSVSTPSPPKADDPREPSLVAVSAGAYVVKRPSEWMDSESVYALLDENPNSFWATKRGDVTAQMIVIALPERTLIKAVEFDNAKIDEQFKGAGAKDVTVEVSDTSDGDGFRSIVEASLKDHGNKQRFQASAEVPGRWVRLVVKNNHSDDPDSTIELDEFRAYGQQLTQTSMPDISGSYNFYFTGDMQLRQEGTSLTGCYASRSGRIEGGIEGHIAKITYFENSGGKEQEAGSGVMIFPPDDKPIGIWWQKGMQEYTEFILAGTKKSSQPGGCGQGAGGVQDQVARDLEDLGRARVYGINFDTDSDKIKEESRPTLEKIAAILKSKPDLKITIEGHTDSTSTPQHNQELSERRAASVKKYLVDAGIDAARLAAAGFGATKPVANNDSELGRAQNRRVELAKL